jgi:sugar lactone lactonase YvrE
MDLTPDGALLVADFGNHRIRRVDAARSVTTVAGAASHGYADGVGIAAQFNSPTGVAVDAAGNAFIADYENQLVRMITPAGLVSTLAGSSRGFANGQGTAAQFNQPHDVAVDPAGNVYVADRDNHMIRKIAPGGLVSTLAGSTQGFAEGSGAGARFSKPNGLAWDAIQGRLLIADTYNFRVRAADVGTGAVTTVAGSTEGYDDGPVASALLRWVTDIAVDLSGNIFICDSSSHRIRKLSAAGVVTTLAGSQFRNSFADGLGLSVAAFNTPWGVAVNSSGHVFVGERRRMTLHTPPPEWSYCRTFTPPPPPPPTPPSTSHTRHSLTRTGDYHNHRVRVISPA